MKKPFLEAGQIVSTHGIRGEVKVMPWADDPEFLLDFDTVYLNGAPVRVQSSRVQKTCVLMKLAGVDDLDAAARLRGQTVCIRREDAQLEVCRSSARARPSARSPTSFSAPATMSTSYRVRMNTSSPLCRSSFWSGTRTRALSV